jgi:hypothetical protein
MIKKRLLSAKTQNRRELKELTSWFLILMVFSMAEIRNLPEN